MKISCMKYRNKNECNFNHCKLQNVPSGGQYKKKKGEIKTKNKTVETDLKIRYKKFKEQLLQTGRNSTKYIVIILPVLYF